MPTSDSTSADISPYSRLDSPPADFYSRASTSATSTFSTSDSWLTCSEREVEVANKVDPGFANGRATAPAPDNDPQLAKKKKVFDAMLSAIDRKKKKNLPKEAQSKFQATQGLMHRPHYIEIAD